jgi:uncharacterized membrane protein
LLYRGATGRWPVSWRFGVGSLRPREQDTHAALAGERGFRVIESVRIDRPVDEVYRFWRNLENLPRFMSHLECVLDLGNDRSHWVAKGPAGTKVAWDAEIINEVEDKVIGWRSLPGSDLVTAGSVNFDPIDGGRATQVTVHLQYEPPGRTVGNWIAHLFGNDPATAIRDDLRRFQQLLSSPGATERGASRDPAAR